LPQQHSNRIFNNICKTPDFERCASDQRAIDIRLPHQLTCVRWLYAPTILDARPPGNCFIKYISEQLANEGMRFLRLGGCSGPASADGPNGFIREDGFDRLFPRQTSQAAAHLRLEHA